jgi:alkyl sulfatase BDS1-like metallo-beta-lactamase superfamily hydrolase
MAGYFDDEESGRVEFPFKDESEFDDNDSARLASMHEDMILNEDGSILEESEGFIEDEESENAATV